MMLNLSKYCHKDIIKSKELFLIIFLGLVLLIPLNFTKADVGACNMECGYCDPGFDTCQKSIMTDLNTTVPFRTTKIGIIGAVDNNASCPNSWIDANSCSDSSGKCLGSAFPSGNNGQSCTAHAGCLGYSCTYIASQGGVWDASGNPVPYSNIAQCVICNGAKEATVLGNTGTIYYGCSNLSGNLGNGKCESACGAAALCDEKAPGESCGTAGETCQPDCTCKAICSSGSCCNLSTGSLKSAGTICGYSDFNGCYGDCQKKRDVYTCTGTSSDCPAIDRGDDYVNVTNSKVCSQGYEVNPSASNYCGTVVNSCLEGACSGHKYYQSCNGSGSCSTNNTLAFDQIVYAANGYTLTSACGTQGTGYCALNQCGESIGRPALICSMRCNGSGSCSFISSCTNHCENNIQDCGETGLNTGGSCSICSGFLTVTASNSGTCSISAFMMASACADQTWAIKDNSNAVKCSGTIIGSSYSNTCSDWVGVGTYTYKLFINGVQKDAKAVTCSNTPFVFSVSTNPILNTVAPGNAVSLPASITLVSGSPALVNLNASNLPAGVTVSFASPGGCTPSASSPCSVQMTVQTTANTPIGVYSIYINGTSGSQIQSAVYGLTIINGIVQPTVVTGTPIVNQNSAILHGSLTDMGNATSVLVWFEWVIPFPYPYGGGSTPFQVMTNTGTFSADITGLSPGTRYSFKAQAKNGGSW
ncbi:MAG: hypothetical protein ABH841_02980 [Candidatus Nealsonbacteria bacterium]